MVASRDELMTLRTRLEAEFLIGLAYRMNVWHRVMFDALESRDASAVFRQSLILFPLVLAAVAMGCANTFSKMSLQREWRTWLNGHVLDRWLEAAEISVYLHDTATDAERTAVQLTVENLRHHLLGSLLGEPVAGAVNDDGLHVVRDELHRLRGQVADACRSADHQDGHRQPPTLALLALREVDVERPVQLEAAAQGFGVGSEAVDVVVDDLLGQWCPGPGGVLRAEEDVLPSPDEILVHHGEPVEGEVPKPLVERPGDEQGR